MSRYQEIRSEMDRLRRRFMEESKRGFFTRDPVSGNHLYQLCSTTAAIFAYEFGGKITGYLHKRGPTQNNSAVIVKEGFGHDFCVIDDQWLVDFWAWYTFQEKDLYDLWSPEDDAIVDHLYGNRTTWGDTRKIFLDRCGVDVENVNIGIVKRIGYELRKF